MQAIGKVQSLHACHILQEERIKLRADPLRKPGIHRAERIAVIRPPIARRLHAGKQKLDVFLSQSLENSGERLLRHLRIDAAQRVVRAKFDDGAIHLFVEAPFQAREPVAAVSPDTPEFSTRTG